MPASNVTKASTSNATPLKDPQPTTRCSESPRLQDPEDDQNVKSSGEAYGLRRRSEDPQADEQYSSDSDDDVREKESLKLKRTSTESKTYTDEEEKAVIRKLDRKLVLFLGLLYMLSFLDRSNIGNARIAGLEDAFSLTSTQFDWLLTVFYITYISFEWMILLYRVLPAHVYISICVLSWGLVASFQALTTSFVQILILRALLGITEAAFGPGVPFYMTFFYKRSELAYRVGLQISAAPLATSFASSLAWIIVKISQNGPIEPWRVLFLVEGFPSVLAAVAAFYYIPDSPGKARYLTSRERKVATLRLESEHAASSSSNSYASSAKSSSRGINFKEVLATISDPKAYLTALMFLCVNVSFSSLPVFLPTIIRSMSFSPLASQGLAAPPYLFAFIFVLVIAHYSDKVPDSRSLFLAAVAFLGAFSYAAIAIAGSLHESIGEAGSITIRYIAVFGAAMGLFSAVTLIITWTLNNQASATGRGTGLTMLNVIGQCGPLIGVHLFPKTDEPLYVKGNAVCAGFMLGVAVLAIALRFYLWKLNWKAGGGEYEMVNLGNEDVVGDGDAEEHGVQETLIGKRIKVATDSGFRFIL